MGTVCDKYWHLFDSLTKCTTKLINGRQSWLLSNMNAVCVYCVDNPQRPMLYNGVFGCHGNMCYVIFIGAILYMIHIIGPSNVCTNVEINRYEIDEVRKYAKIVFYLTSRDAKTGTWPGTLWNQPEVSTTSGSNVMAQIVIFVFSVTLTFDICSIFCLMHCTWCTGISMLSFIRSFEKTLCFIMGYLVAMEIRVICSYFCFFRCLSCKTSAFFHLWSHPVKPTVSVQKSGRKTFNKFDLWST